MVARGRIPKSKPEQDRRALRLGQSSGQKVLRETVSRGNDDTKQRSEG